MTTLNYTPTELAKRAAAAAAIDLIAEGMLIGLGSGSTTAYFIDLLGQRFQKGLSIKVIASSYTSEKAARKYGIPFIANEAVSQLDLTVDGADEIDWQKNMIKGGGGALLKEKIIAKSSREMLVIVDETKLVTNLGTFPVPVEISPFFFQTTLHRLKNEGYEGNLRLTREGNVYQTDSGHYIYDVRFSAPILDPFSESLKLKKIVGVLEVGLFYGLAGRVIVGYFDGTAKIFQKLE